MGERARGLSSLLLGSWRLCFKLVNAFYQNPRISEVYNIGGSRFSNCSMVEAIKICEATTDKKTKSYSVNIEFYHAIYMVLFCFALWFSQKV